MKVLLVGINAKYIHSNPALYSLSGYAGNRLQSRVDIEIAEYTINELSESILADIYARHADIIMFSCYIWNISVVEELCAELGKLVPSVPIWLGGPEAGYDSEGCMRRIPSVTGVISGEGEETVTELIEYYTCLNGSASVHHMSKLSDISGITFRCDKIQDGFMHTAPRHTIDFSINSFTTLCSYLQACEDRIIYYESSRGCPFRCTYCLSSIEKPVRYRDIELVKKELDVFLEKRVRQVKFVDRTFNCNSRRAVEIWSYLLEHDNGYSNFHFEIGADLLDEEQLEVLSHMRTGFIQLEIGVQSTNEKTLCEINRYVDTMKLETAVKRVKSFSNMHIHLDLIAGLPFEDMRSFERSFCRVYSMKPSQLQLGFLKVLKGTAMYDKSREYGIAYRSKPPYEVLSTRWLSYEDICLLKQIEEMIEIYYNTAQFAHALDFLEGYCENSFRMYMKLAAYYHRRGGRSVRYSRLQCYEMLYSCAQEIIAESVGMSASDADLVSAQGIFGELLLHDMYLRENIGKRPSFAKSQTEYKQLYKELMRSPEFIEKYGTDVHIEHFNRESIEHMHAEEESTGCFMIYSYSYRSLIDGNAQAVCCSILS